MLCCFQSHVQKLAEGVKEHEDYNSKLQEVEKWLLQMSSRLVTSDSMQSDNLETATQQLARHKVGIFLYCDCPHTGKYLLFIDTGYDP